MTDLNCSIVIRAYNEEKHIERLFSGLGQQNISAFEVILVDSGSSDATIEIAKSEHWDFPVQILNIQPEQFSFGRSLNLGIKHAMSDIIVIASAHVYPVYPDWIERLISPFTDAKVGLTYGKQRGSTTTRFSENQILARWYPEQSKIQKSNPFCNNANAAIRKDLWLRHNYDDTLSGLEDLEWAHWAIEQGCTVSYVAEAEIIHTHEDTPRGVYNRYRREAMAFKRIFPHEQFGFFDFVRLFFTNLVSDSASTMRDGKFIREVSNIIWFRLMQFWGTYRGYQQSGPLTQDLRKTFYYPGDSPTNHNHESRNVKPIQYKE
ncbi:MAG TPA: glycosyltransferase family 2 protein [Anaerolineales bacterium]|nr:glycosyltransferase family 2 protein [Anaerolineales bacterium]